MTEFFDTKGIPDEAAYWDALATRVAAGAQAGSFARIATSPAAWAAALLLVTAAGLLVLAARGRDRPDLGREIAQALAPADFPGGTLVGVEGTSAFGALLFQPAASGGER